MLNRYLKIVVLTSLLALSAGCRPAAPTATQDKTATPLPPTVTPPTLRQAQDKAAVPVSPTATLAPPTLAPMPESALPTPPPAGGLIAFVSTRDGNGEIYVMRADGSQPRRLTNWRLWDGYPSWSPDGSQIAYYSYVNSKDWVIKVIDVGGGEPRQLTDNGICDGAPYWSPDGTQIAYGSDADCSGEQREVYVIDTDGGNPRNLTQNDADDVDSSWSPDSQRIVFASNRDGNYELYVMDVTGGEARRLTENDAQDMMPSWSPDGSQIAFVSDRDGNDEIYLMDIDGGNARRLTEEPDADWFPFWSPDGSQIVFNSRRDGNLEVYTLDVASGAVRRLTDNPAEDFNAVWQPIAADAGASRVQAATWTKTYQGELGGTALDALQSDDGGYLLVGATNYSHRDTAREDVHLAKTDPNGEITWEKIYGGDKYDRGTAIVQASAGGFVILGETESFGAGNRDVYLLHVDQEGNELWSTTFGGPGIERANAMQPTGDGGYILVGSTTSFDAVGEDLYLVRTDQAGNTIWSQAYSGEYHEQGYAAYQTPDGGFLVLFQTLHGVGPYPEQDPDTHLLKTDEAGNEIWTRAWDGPGVQGGSALLPTSDGHYVITGIFSPDGTDRGMDFMFIKVDAEGNVIWDRPTGSADALDYGSDVIETDDGGYVLTGMYAHSGVGAIPLIEADQDGQVIWSQHLREGRGNKVAIKIFQAPDGGYVVVAQTDEQGRGFETILIKTDSKGNVGDAASTPPTPELAATQASAGQTMSVTIVYDNTAYDPNLQAEWGFAAWIEYGGHTLLFDTGGDSSILLGNMEKLGLDPQQIEIVVLSHKHDDHTGGLRGLLDSGVRPTVYVPALFPASFKEWVQARTELVEVQDEVEILPGLYSTGELRGSVIEQALVLETSDGLVVITGCAHPGIVRIAREAQEIVDGDVALVMGGFHLGEASRQSIESIISDLRQLGVRQVSPTHCTGESAISMFAEAFGEDYVPGGVGRVFVVGGGESASTATPVPPTATD